MGLQYLRSLPLAHARGQATGIASVCSAHPKVIEATLLEGLERETPVLIEATCNQVNQEGGYTGMTPADFRRFVEVIAARVGFDSGRIILGGDHLGPNPWKHLPADEAMAKAEDMVRAYVSAGFTKIHLDTSMGCKGETVALPDAVTAERAARLAAASESAAGGTDAERPVYVIGTEVPIPGGAMEVIDDLRPTTPDAAVETVEVHRRAFARLGLEAAFERAIAVVVQPGVEFGNENVHHYDRTVARSLSDSLGSMPQFVFEAHSTDYQSVSALRELVEDGFAILKVGPAVTFALREAFYGLDRIAAFLHPNAMENGLAEAMERLMVREARHWDRYYHGSDEERRLQRHFSYSDRIRYYWPHPEAAAAVDGLLARLGTNRLPETLISQYLGALYPAVVDGRVEPTADALLLESIRRVVRSYNEACLPRAAGRG